MRFCIISVRTSVAAEVTSNIPMASGRVVGCVLELGWWTVRRGLEDGGLGGVWRVVPAFGFLRRLAAFGSRPGPGCRSSDLVKMRCRRR